MTDENVIPGRRVVGFVALALAAVVGTMAFGAIVGSCRPGVVEPIPSPVAATASPPAPPITSPSPSSIQNPGLSSFDVPGEHGTIPPIVPIPSGPFP
jgi:hypothetical protein